MNAIFLRLRVIQPGSDRSRFHTFEMELPAGWAVETGTRVQFRGGTPVLGRVESSIIETHRHDGGVLVKCMYHDLVPVRVETDDEVDQWRRVLSENGWTETAAV